jgi:hypothetical protein
MTCSPTGLWWEGRRGTGGNAVDVDAGLRHHEDRTPTHGYEATREAGRRTMSSERHWSGKRGELDLGQQSWQCELLASIQRSGAGPR